MVNKYTAIGYIYCVSLAAFFSCKADDSKAVLEKRLYLESWQLATQSNQEARARALSSVVTVSQPLAKGLGFFINSKGYLVTASRLVKNSAGELTVTVKSEGCEEEYDKVRIIALNTIMGLALLKIEAADGKDFNYAPLADYRDVQSGQPVFLLANHRDIGMAVNGADSVVTVRARAIGQFIYIQHSIPVTLLNDGGPLFNKEGEVIGINIETGQKFSGAGFGFSLPVAFIKLFVNHRAGFAFNATDSVLGNKYYSIKKSQWLRNEKK
ncbi:hypothetical protein BVY04_01200 [bacterium M21]|nr:hypothetical protein BVY04_01200 [bacterium M21]